jgi:hypothetical protein
MYQRICRLDTSKNIKAEVRSIKMEAWKERLVAEHQELTERIRKLEVFLKNTDVFSGKNQESLLKVQAAAMKTYQAALLERMIDLGIEPTSKGDREG